MTPWEKVVWATERHVLVDFDVRMTGSTGDRAWLYLRCSCGEPYDDDWREPADFTDHIRRIVFHALQDDGSKDGAS